jgi:hypothetical protein
LAGPSELSLDRPGIGHLDDASLAFADHSNRDPVFGAGIRVTIAEHLEPASGI